MKTKIKLQRYEIDGLLKFAEEDIFKEGCQPETCQTFDISERFRAGSVKELIQQVCDFLGTPTETKKDGKYYDLNSCDEDGRIDFFVLEDADGMTASAHDIADWKQGQKKLWSCIYTAQVHLVTRECPVLREEEL